MPEDEKACFDKLPDLSLYLGGFSRDYEAFKSGHATLLEDELSASAKAYLASHSLQNVNYSVFMHHSLDSAGKPPA